MSVPGIGPIISSAMVAAIGSGDAFCERPRLRRLAGPSPQAELDWRPHGVMTAIWGRGPKILWDVGRSQRFLQSDISDGEFFLGGAGGPTGFRGGNFFWRSLFFPNMGGAPPP